MILNLRPIFVAFCLNLSSLTFGICMYNHFQVPIQHGIMLRILESLILASDKADNTWLNLIK